MNKVIVSFGRYNPPTLGHGKLFDTMFLLSRKQKADMKIFASHTQDKKKNPLSYRDKIQFLKLSFPKYKNSIVYSKSRTMFDVLEELVNSGYTDIILVVGDDRVSEFKKLIDIKKFNSNHDKKINSFKVVSAGERDPDSDDAIEAMSSSKLREFASNNKLKDFKKGLSKSLTNDEVLKLFQLVRNGLEINNSEEKHMKESVKPGFDPAGNPSRLWQTFRQWFYLQEEDRENQPDSDFLVVDKKSGERHLPVKVNGKPDHRLMGAAYAALTVGYRGNKYDGPNKSEALTKLKTLYNKEKMELPK